MPASQRYRLARSVNDATIPTATLPALFAVKVGAIFNEAERLQIAE
jgi:hypothetical protein